MCPQGSQLNVTFHIDSPSGEITTAAYVCQHLKIPSPTNTAPKAQQQNDSCVS